jgi:hypothetical protein
MRSVQVAISPEARVVPDVQGCNRAAVRHKATMTNVPCEAMRTMANLASTAPPHEGCGMGVAKAIRNDFWSFSQE